MPQNFDIAALQYSRALNGNLYAVVHRGGTTADLEEVLGMKSQSISHAVSANGGSWQNVLCRVIEMMRYRGDASPLRVMANQLGYRLVPVTADGNGSVADKLMSSVAEFGDVVRRGTELVAKLSAGRGLSDSDKTEMLQEIHELQEQLAVLQQSVASV